MEEPNPFYLIMIGIVAVVLIIIMYNIMAQFKSVSIEPTYDAEAAIYHNIFMNSPKCFAYQDILTGRVYNEIDLAKFDLEHLLRCVGSVEEDNLKFGVRLTLKDDEGNVLSSVEKDVRAAKTGRKVESAVIIRDNGKKYIGELVTEVKFSG